MPIPVYDIAIIGGGINGCGVARDAAGRGLKVHLCEQGDLAGAASSASTKLFHGDQRFNRKTTLRSFREAAVERDNFLAVAPHLVRPQFVVQPRGAMATPEVLARAGHFALDLLSGHKYLPATRQIDLKTDQSGHLLKRDYRSGFEFSDCWIDDARLVIANAVDANARGAHIHTRMRCVAARRADSYWRLLLESTETGERRQIAARALVNAAGSRVAHVLEHIVRGHARAFVRLVKGTHIVTRRLYHHDRAYLLKNDDGRSIFMIPYGQDFTLIGTTETDFRGDPGAAVPDEGEIEYLCRAASRYFREPVTREAIRFVYCGVRPVPDEASSGQRSAEEAVLDLDGSEGSSPLISIIGGRIASYRRTAEQTLSRLSPFLRMGASWTSGASLPGGGFAVGRAVDLVRALRAAYPFLSELHAERLVNAYGTRAALIVTGARQADDLGRNFGYDLTEAEVVYLMAEEWAVTAGDVLWRRSQLGLYFTDGQREALDAWMASVRSQATTLAAQNLN